MTNTEKDKKDSFENIAKTLGCDESEDALDRAIDGLNVRTDSDKKPVGGKKEDNQK